MNDEAHPRFPVATPTDPARADGMALEEDQQEQTVSSVLILGTAHVVPLTNAIHHHVFEFDPDVVALELDKDRLQGLLMDPEDRAKPGLGYGLVAKFQESIAEDLGGEVGEEMMAAREAAMLIDAPVALVDRPVQESLDRLLDQMGWFERLKVIGSLVAAFIPGKSIDEELQRALDGDPELIREVEEKFPTVKEVLIDERDAYMANRVRALANEHGRVLLVVGDAHVPGIREALSGSVDAVDTVRVKELRRHDDAGASFQVEDVHVPVADEDTRLSRW